MGHPALNVTSTNFTSNAMLSIAPVNSSAVQSNGTVYCGFATALTPTFSTWENGQCVLNSTMTGQTYGATSSISSHLTVHES